MRLIDYKNYIFSMILPTFEWKNLPDGLEGWMIEEKVMVNGKCAIFKHNDNWYAEHYSLHEQHDIYNKPIKIKITSINSEINELVIEKGYLHYLLNNSNSNGWLNDINCLVKELVKIDKRIMENIDMNRFQLFLNIGATDKNKKVEKDVKRLAAAISRGEMVVAIQEGILTEKNVIALSELMNDNSLNIWENWFNKWTQLTKMTGISVNETNYKKANVNTGELNVSKETVDRVLEDMLMRRRDFIKRIQIENPEWKEVSVEFRFKQEEQDLNPPLLNKGNER